jgi:sensor domain CHASE-containing protein
MRLRTRVIALIGCLFAVLGLAQFLVQQQVLLPSFTELERQAAKTDMQRVEQALRRELDLLLITARDYGNWDETYRFIRNRNAEYVTTNLTPETMETLRVNVIAFITPDGGYAWAAGRQLVSGAALELDLLANGEFPADNPWRTEIRDGGAMVGILNTNQGALLAALAPILDGKGGRLHRGMVLFGRLITNAEIARIGEQAQVRLSRVALLPPDSHAKPQTETLVEGEGFTEVFRLFADVAGAPVFKLRIEVPRAISARGAEVVSYATLFLLASGIVVLLLTIMMLNRTLLSPLAKVTRQAVAVGDNDDLSARINLNRSDEIGELAREFDRMVGKLAEARRQLVDQSFDAGIAENASGVLHNLGNAMTPLTVKVAGLQDSLRAAPTGDIELVLAELKQTGADASRRADLDEFLALTGRELARVVTGAQQQVDSVARHALAIQEVLSAQTRQARAGAVIETVSLPELVEQSAELVAPALRQRLAIEVDQSLAALGAVRVARTSLKQVLQNLIVNAAEAIHAAGLERGSLRVSAAALATDGDEQLHLCFADDGVGIVASDLTRIFEKGFSTKPAAANSGIGLHWCANTINALGGTIRAESAGPRCGATMHVVLPLDRTTTRQLRHVA